MMDRSLVSLFCECDRQKRVLLFCKHAGQRFNIIILCAGKVVFYSNVYICCFQLCYMPDGSYTYQASTWSGSLGANDTRQVIFVIWFY